MTTHYETFQDFIERNPHYKPIKHEEMGNVYRKQHEAFIAYVNERVEGKMREIKLEYTANDIRSLRKVAFSEILREAKERFPDGEHSGSWISEEAIESRVKTYIMAGLLPADFNP